ncbi:MAG: hypothetical protein MZU79_04385 [Anaerotruncus sp.]|nr:hypothetical protein [Anaerotruncus sp.]
MVEYYGTYLRDIADPPCPILHIDGNHDVREEGGRISRAFFGETDFTFDLDDMRFVFLDNVHGDEDFGFSREQLIWLDNALKAPHPVEEVRLRPRAPQSPVPADHAVAGLPLHPASRERAGIPGHPRPSQRGHGRLRPQAHPRLPGPQRRSHGHHGRRRPEEFPGARGPGAPLH